MSCLFQWKGCGLGLGVTTSLTLVDNGVDLLNHWSDLLGDTSVGLDDFPDLLDDWFGHFMDQSVRVVLGSGVLDGGGARQLVRLLYVQARAGRSEVEMD